MTVFALKVEQISENNPGFKTYRFRHALRAKPGQFVMVWLPGVDEIPMSVGWQEEGVFEIGVAVAGDCTQAIYNQVKVGDRLGIRGPFGKAFDLKEYKNIVLVGGGCGTPPMIALAQKAKEKGADVTAIVGARTEKMLIYEKQFNELGCETLVSTDDGSKGHKGYSTDVLAETIKKNKPDCVYACGPEMMMVKVAQMAKAEGIDCQVSLERYMKCGFGICGQCCIDDSGARVCKDGPVFSGEEALESPEFGKYHRTASGQKIDWFGKPCA